MSDELPLDGRVAIVTGALGRLGPVWRAALADAGATVVGIDLKGADDVLEADVTDRASLEQVRSKLSDPPSILVNNAGIDQPPEAEARTYEVEDVPLDDFRRTLDINLAGTFTATQ